MKLIPDSFSDFQSIIRENYIYIDKTAFIDKYERTGSRVSLFLRPRRFGKTMFTEILRYYYDKALEKEADELFRNTWIADHPTPRKSSYAVLKLDCSGIRTIGGIEDTMNFFMKRIANGICDFYCLYPELIPTDLKSENIQDSIDNISKFYDDRKYFTSPAKIIDNFLERFISRKQAFRLMIIIDEYDNFTNDILCRDPQMFAAIARKEGELGSFYGTLRNYQQSKVIEKIFITGVLPVTMDTAVSGFTSAKLSFKPELNSLAGFTDSEVLELIRESVDFEKCSYYPEKLQQIMKLRFDGYRFSRTAKENVYNSAMCLSFLSELRDNEFESIPPFSVMSANDVDYVKLTGYLDLINPQERGAVVNAILRGRIIPYKTPGTVKLAAEHETLTKDEGLAILYHLGFFTLASKDEIQAFTDDRDDDWDYLRVPNEHCKMLFSKYWFDKQKVSWSLFDSTFDLRGMARANDSAVMAAFLRAVAPGFVNTDNVKLGEAQVVLAMYTALTMNTGSSFRLTREYAIRHNGAYVMRDSPEPDTENAAAGSSEYRINIRAGRADLVAENIRGSGPSYIFEVKYAQDVPAREETKTKVREKLFRAATEQLDFYVTDDTLKALPDLRRYLVMLTYGELSIQEV
ncbi:AAA family ATPase [Succinimonas sp.]|uniref:AAA family ATPase n=1 Tax=Succinimonas sp. TaxID=1936151 RepID=UPI003867250A